MRPGIEKTLPDFFRKVVEESKPDIWWLEFPAVGKVTKVYEDSYTVDVQIINGPFLPDIPVNALAAGDGWGIWALPTVGTEVTVDYEKGDITEPFVLAATWRKNKPPSGFKAGQIAIVDKTGQEISIKPDTGQITIKANVAIQVTAPVVNVESANVNVTGNVNCAAVSLSGGASASSGPISSSVPITLQAPSINLGGEGGEPVLLGRSAVALLMSHTHPAPDGTTGQSPELTTLSTAISRVTKAK